MLELRRHNDARLLEHGVVAPLRVQLGQRGRDAVVFVHEQRLKGSQAGVGVEPEVAAEEAPGREFSKYVPLV